MVYKATSWEGGNVVIFLASFCMRSHPTDEAEKKMKRKALQTIKADLKTMLSLLSFM